MKLKKMGIAYPAEYRLDNRGKGVQLSALASIFLFSAEYRLALEPIRSI
jgi:hypothetical protein